MPPEFVMVVPHWSLPVTRLSGQLVWLLPWVGMAGHAVVPNEKSVHGKLQSVVVALVSLVGPKIPTHWLTMALVNRKLVPLPSERWTKVIGPCPTVPPLSVVMLMLSHWVIWPDTMPHSVLRESCSPFGPPVSGLFVQSVG